MLMMTIKETQIERERERELLRSLRCCNAPGKKEAAGSTTRREKEKERPLFSSETSGNRREGGNGEGRRFHVWPNSSPVS